MDKNLVNIFELKNQVNLEGAGLPFTIHKKKHLEMFESSYQNGIPVAIVERGRPVEGSIAVAGRVVIVQRNPDGSIEAVVFGDMRVKIGRRVDSGSFFTHQCNTLKTKTNISNESDMALLREVLLAEVVKIYPGQKMKILKAMAHNPAANMAHLALLKLNIEERRKVSVAGSYDQRIKIILEALMPEKFQCKDLVPSLFVSAA